MPADLSPTSHHFPQTPHKNATAPINRHFSSTPPANPMSVVVGEDAAVFQSLPSDFDHRSHACLRIPEDEDGYDEVRIYAGRMLEGHQGANPLSHYTVTNSIAPFRKGCGDYTCGEPCCPDCNSDYDSDDDLENWECVVSPGNCMVQFEFEGTTLWLLTREEGPPVKPEYSKPCKFKEVLLFAPGRDSIDVLKEFVRRARLELMRRPKGNKFSLYRWQNKCSFWRCYGDHPGREPATLIFPTDVCADILADLNDFYSVDTRKWYVRCGIPYKRSFLLYGPPGSGKSSLIRMIATQCRRSVCYLQPAGMSDAALADAMEDIPRKSILVLEDVDALFAAGRRSKDKNKLTFSGVLNALDGLISPQNGQLIVMTSNHPEKLDPAMIRCGRVDRRFELPSPNSEQAQKMFHNFYPETAGTPKGQAAAQNFAQQCLDAAKVDDHPLSMASLQNYFILGRKLNHMEFLEKLPGFIEEEHAVGAFGSANTDIAAEHGDDASIACENGGS